MNAILDPQSLKAAFDDRAEAEAAFVADGIELIKVLDLEYRRKPALSLIPTALTTNDGDVDWEPAGAVIHPWHYDLDGESVGPQNGGLFPAATVDVRDELEKAFDAALVTGRPLVGDPTLFYGVSAPITFGARVGMTTVAPGAKMINIKVKAMIGDDGGAAWTAGDNSDPDPDNWTPGAAVLYIGRHPAVTTVKYRASSENCTADAGRIASIAVHNYANPQSSHFRLQGQSALCFSHMIGVPGGSGSLNCTSTLFIDCGGVEWDGTGEGYLDYSLRTSVGLAVYGADMTIIRPDYAIHKINLAFGTLINIDVENAISWNGNHVATEAGVVNMIVGENCSAYRFKGCRWDEGGIKIRSFKGSFIGNHFHEYTGGALIDMVATATGEKAGQFVFVGNYIGGASAVTKSTEGSGSWADFDGWWGFNSTQSGANFTIDGFTLVHNDNFAVDAAGLIYINQQQVIGYRQSAIADASGGSTVDTEARAAINSLLASLRTHGLIAT